MKLLAVISGLSTFAVGASVADAQSGFNGDFDLYNDYVERGLTYSRERLSVQGRLEYAFAAGPYAGVVIADKGDIVNKETVEVDPYGGYRIQRGDWSIDTGFFSWMYIHSRLDWSRNTYDTVEATADVTYKVFGIKVWYDLLNYWGLDSASAGPNYHLVPEGPSQGSTYIDSHLSLPLTEGITLKMHVGHQFIRNYGELDYTDWLAGFEKTLGHYVTLGLEYTHTNANALLYTDDGGLNLARGKWLGYVRVSFP